jgi:dihydrodipicolinate synthase/N-acetylneuraminate lyase
MAIFTKLLRIIGLLALGGVCAGALTACSAVKLGYGAAPELAFWRLDAYLDFDDAQAAQVRDDLATLHQWHRSNELPRYAALLEQAERLAPATSRRPRPAPWLPRRASASPPWPRR